jgi:hypothetical protein
MSIPCRSPGSGRSDRPIGHAGSRPETGGYDDRARSEVGAGGRELIRERQPGDRLRVVIAGNIYAKRTLVRRFLEDDGFDVVGEALTRDELLSLGGIAAADAVVVDGELLDGSIDALRAAAPDAAIVVFTNPTGGVAGPRGADGYLEKGMGLASLTALLHSLLTEAPASPLGLSWSTPAPAPPPSERRVLAGLAGVAAGVVLVAVVALAVFGGAGTVPISHPIALPSASPGTPTTTPRPGPSALDVATADLRELERALAEGRTIEARSALQDLDAILAAAHPTFATGAFAASAADALRPFLSAISGTLLDQLRAVFGDVLHVPTGSTSTGGTILTGSTTGSTTTTGSTGGSDGSTSGGGSSTGATGGGSGSGSGDGSGSGGGGSGSGGGSEQPTASHGNGHHYGWTNKPPEGGWHGTKPASDHRDGSTGGSDHATGHGDAGGDGHAIGVGPADGHGDP